VKERGKPAARGKRQQERKRILVVEDSPTQAERLRLVLEADGYEVRVARNGRAGLDSIRSSPPDLVISDVVMPEMDGYELCQRVKSSRATQSIPFVLLTGQRTPADIIRGLERGADNFITKPFEDEHLLGRIHRIFEHLEHRAKGRFEMEVAIRVGGHEIVLNADKQQMIELLFATSEELAEANTKLEQSRRIIEDHARDLEEKVRARTADLAKAEERYRKQAQQQAAVAALGRRALEGVDLQKLLDDGTRVVVQTLDADLAFLVGTAGEGRSLLIGTGTGWSTGAPGHKTLERDLNSLAGFTLRAGKPVTVEDLNTETRFTVSQLLREHGAVAGVAVPVGAPGKQFGVLGAFDRELRRYSDDELYFLESVAGVLGAAVEQHRARKALRQSEERFRRVVEASPTGIVATDHAGSIVLVNQATEKMFGYARDELLNRSIEILVPEAFRAKHFVEREAFGADRNARRVGVGREVAGRRKDGGTLIAEVGLIHFESEQGPLMLATIVDVTERRHLEDRLRSSEKMEALGRVAGGIAHDFNNVLAAIMVVGEVAQKQTAADHPVQGHLKEIQKAARQAAELTRRMLAFSRNQVMHPRALDLNKVIEGTRKMLERLIGEDVQLIVRLGATQSTVVTDPTQIEQVLVNLAVNARDAMPHGGTLTFETSNVVLDEEYVRAHGGKEGSYVMLSVADTGVGMDEATQSHIFEPFFTTKPEGKGTGFGLATVYGIVRQSGGFIWVYSEPGQGATFKVYLPWVEQIREQESETAGSPESEPRAGAATILMVEDQESLRRIMQGALERQGYAVLSAPDGITALDLVRRHHGPIDLLLTDVVMPGMNGRELAERVVAERAGTRVLYISGYSNNSVADRGLLSGEFDMLEKPFTATSLLQAVENAMRKG